MLDPHFSKVRDACIQGQTIFLKKKKFMCLYSEINSNLQTNITKKNGMIGRLLGEYQN